MSHVVAELKMRKNLSVLKNRLFGRSPTVDDLTYWEQRTRVFGAQAVMNLHHAPAEIENVTRRQVAEIFPHLRAVTPELVGKILDFGCGPGRFSSLLHTQVGAPVVAVDPTQGLLDLAPRSEGVHYARVIDGRVPLEDASVDLLWVCLVLGGIREAALPDCVAELRRVLRPGAGICVVENTAEKPDAERWFFRRPEFYEELFRFVPVKRVHDYEDVGERITVLTGRCA